MKKKILFIVSNMESGGVSKSMSTLLNVLDTDRFDVDVLILNPSGIFMELLPKNINIISDRRTQLLFSKFPNNILTLIKNGYLSSAVLRLLAAFFMTFNKGIGGRFLAKGIVKINKHYDLAVDYNGQHQLYYMVNHVNAKVKASFFHSDYAQWDYYYKTDKKYYPKVDKIFTISEICVKSLKRYFPKQQHKINLFENISSFAFIESLAKTPIEPLVENSIITVGHLTEKKGTLLALVVASLLKEKGVVFKWYFLGEDAKDHDYKKMVLEKGLSDYVRFLGVSANPYPYIKNAKIMVHLSYFEGKSIALDEAKLLCKPSVVTNFSTVGDQFSQGYNATIVDFDTEEIAAKIMELLTNRDLREKYSENLKKDRTTNLSEVEKLYALI